MIPRLLLSGLALIAAVAAHSADVESLIRQASAAESALNSQQALELLLRAESEQPDNPLILQKIAKQYSDLVLDQPDIASKKQYANHALRYSERAVALNPKDPVSVLSLAISHGKLAVYSDNETKVKYSRLIREEAERALTLKPDYAWAHHVLGRWHYEIAGLGTTSRFFAKLFYGGLPKASFETAITELTRATELEPDELNHWLELGFAYAAAGKNSEARQFWERGLKMPSRNKHDEPAKQRAREALAALN